MTKEQFLQKLSHNLRYLTKKEKKEVLKKYENSNNFDLDPIEVANKIYEEKKLKVRVYPDIKLFDAVNVIINKLQEKNKEVTKNIIFFFLYLLLLLIVIKIPFIYVRDTISSFFEMDFVNNNLIAIWYFIFEICYAITTIIVFIKLIKKKSFDLKKMD